MILYHGSKAANVDFLEPRSKLHGSNNEKVVYLSGNKAYALVYIWDSEKTNYSLKWITCALEVTGVNFMEEMGFENIIIPKQTYVVFETARQKFPMAEYMDIRERLVSEWLPDSGYVFSDGPELALVHWRIEEQKEKRFVEIWIPIEASFKRAFEI